MHIQNLGEKGVVISVVTYFRLKATLKRLEGRLKVTWRFGKSA